MSSKALTIPLIRHILKRGYAQAVNTAYGTDMKILSSKLPDQTVLCAVENACPVTRVTVAYRAGARYEPWCELGLTHVLRSAAGLTTDNSSGFMIYRRLAQLGASVSASGDREFIYYTLEATRENLPDAVEVFTDMISGQYFRPWELDDNNPRLRYDLVAIPPQVRAIDLLHKAAFRRGLGNSLFISPRKIGHISSESLQHYIACAFTPANTAVAVVGDTLEQANFIASTIKNDEIKGGVQTEAKYLPGEVRKEMGGELAHVALALQGAAATAKNSLALAIAAKALGAGPATKWGQSNSPLAKAMGNIGPVAAAGFSVGYSDTGLFGVIMSIPKDEARQAVIAAANVLRCTSLSCEQILAAKNQLKTQLLCDADTGALLSESLAAEALYTGAAKLPLDWVNEINKISDNEVNAVLKEVQKSHFTMGAAGNLAFVPFIDEL